MKLAIMQPYLFPYIGYFQLLSSVDAIVIYDDVSYIKGGWINRNYILGRDGRQLFTLQVENASSNRLINEVRVGSNKNKLLKTFHQNYSNAAQYNIVYSLLEKIFLVDEINLAKFIERSLLIICEYLELFPKWYISSELEKNNSLQGQKKVLSICKLLGAKQYINLPGGRTLYNEHDFEKEDIKLSIIEPTDVVYHQFNNQFISNLSIIDVMMFNDRRQLSRLLREYKIVE